MSKPETNYQFANQKPGTHRSRNGEHFDVRTKIQWEQAFEGHVRSVHEGVFQKDCAACMELRKKAQ